jgi:hypothetical protein
MAAPEILVKKPPFRLGEVGSEVGGSESPETNLYTLRVD